MKNTRKVLALITALFLLAALLSGCGGTPASKSAPASATNAPATDAPPAVEQKPDAEPEPVAEPSYFPLAEEAEITVFCAYSPELTNYLSGAEEFLIFTEAQDRLNISLKFSSVPFSTAADNLNLMLTSYDLTDIISSFLMFYKKGVDAAIDQEYIIDIAPHVEDYCANYYSVISSKPEYMKEVVSDTGKMGAVYSLYEDHDLYADSGHVIREDWLNKLSLEVPETVDDIEAALLAMKAEFGTEGYGLMASGISNVFLSAYGIQAPYATAVSGFSQKDGEVLFGAATDGYKEYLTTMNRWYSEGIVYQDFMSDTSSARGSTVESEVYSTGRVAVTFTSLNNFSTFEANGIDNDPEFSWTALGPIVLKEGDASHFATMNYVMANCASAVSAQCEDVELALRYLDFWFSEEGYTLANWGTEGYSFEYVDGKPQFTELVTNNPDGMGLTVAYSAFTGRSGAVAYCEDLMKYFFVYNEKETNAAYYWVRNSDTAYVISNNISMTEDESSAYSAAFAEIKTCVEEATMKFIIGERDLSEFDDYVATLYDLGLQECIDIYQAAYGRYLER